MSKTAHLVIGILLSLLVVVTIGLKMINGHPLTASDWALNGALIVFAVSRFIMFKNPDSPIARPMRMGALVIFVLYLVMKNQH